ncbi:TetR/AcrR family transcriptional regulator [Halomonas shantousis]
MPSTKKAEAKRRHILDTGYRLVLNKGFVAVGLQEILKTCGIPKGSFYHYFPSKEAFGCELLQEYIDDYGYKLDQLLSAAESGRDSLMRYWDAWITDPAAPERGWAEDCLVVKLAAEVADMSENMRRVLDDGVQQLMVRIANLIEEGRDDGSLPDGMSPLALARVLYQMWLGAALLAKLSQDKTPLQQARDATLHLLACNDAAVCHFSPQAEGTP